MHAQSPLGLRGNRPGMGDDDDGHAFVVDLPENVEDIGFGIFVEVAGRLVRQDELRLVHERARQGHAPLLAAGKLAGIGIDPVAQAYQLQQVGGALRG